jgi:hypothetical protein
MWKWFTAFAAVALMVSYLGAIALKLKEFSLAAVIVIGIVMMLVDLWQSMRSQDS